MPQGLQVFAPNGEVIVDTNDRFSRIMGHGTFAAPQWANSVTDSFVDIPVAGLNPGPDFLVIATKGRPIEIFPGFFRFRTGDAWLPGESVVWTAWAR